MKTIPLGIAGVAAAAGLLIFSAFASADPRSAAPAEGELLGPVVLVTFPDGSTVTTSAETGLSELVALDAQQTVQILLTFPVSLAGQKIEIQAADGGTAASDWSERFIASDGTVAFAFQSGAQPGQYRITTTAAGAVSTIQFWVPNPNDAPNPAHLIVRHKPKAK